ncbi:MAG TPA: hypothetical protein VFX58_13310 [Chitinophagaceae bacterium]|nr:hypothetical protein [Chitinophagaceae bacterium]
MKKIFNQRFATGLVAITVSLLSQAQDLAIQTKFKVQPASSASYESNKAPLSLSQVNARVLRHFNRHYSEVSAPRWFKTEKGFAVRFEKGPINSTVFYTSQGYVNSQINYYTEDQLPAAVRHLVKSNFYDYAITHVTEVIKDDVVSRLVKIAKGNLLKTIKVIDGEWEIMEEFEKN